MMQSPQIIHALAKQSDRIAPSPRAIERESGELAPVRRPAHAAEPRPTWFWQLLFGRRGAVTS